ncbi:hypothetical protein CYMTET_33517 [Cymbomonas tetramitiformis]|uniref:Uncharacterized protein n=1 Tax=Cymbomonas tetramitiformis TaxID=36881 RepID=A0AAE0FCY4_9CHLO|nr:hypothetical protein CYMTET_33517 [Cymbomonas tetramitiformis]
MILENSSLLVALFFSAAIVLVLPANPEEIATLDYNRKSFFPNRQAWNPCSLYGVTDGDPLENNCQLESYLGTGDTGWNLLRFGEQNCVVTLKNCQPGLCYTARDVTGLLKQDQVSRPLPSSVFSTVKVISGGKVRQFSQYGFALEATSKEVTHLCRLRDAFVFLIGQGEVGSRLSG